MKEIRFDSILNYIGVNEQESVSEDALNSVIDSVMSPDVSYAQDILDAYDESDDMATYFNNSLDNCIRAGNVNGAIGLLHLKGAGMTEKFTAGGQAHLYNIKLYRGEPDVDENAPEEVKKKAFEESELFRDTSKAKEAEQQHLVFEQARMHYLTSLSKKNVESTKHFPRANKIQTEAFASED